MGKVDDDPPPGMSWQTVVDQYDDASAVFEIGDFDVRAVGDCVVRRG
jgi:hypothetical protein